MQTERPVGFLILVLALLFAGCSPSDSPAADRAVAHMKVLGLLYGQFMANHGGAPPANEEAFVAFLREDPKNWEKLASSPEAFLASAEEGRPIVVRYGNDLKQPADGSLAVVAYEDAGDQRLLVNVRGNVETLDRLQLDERLSTQ